MSFHMLTRERIARSPDKPRDTNVPLMLLSLALGAFALSISLGYGLPSAGLVAAGLSIGGLAIWLYNCWDDAGPLRKDTGVL